MKPVLLTLIRLYQKTLSPDHGLLSYFSRRGVCIYHPTCSQYAYEATQNFGAVKGCWLTIKRIGRCHPWGEGGYDPVK